LPIRQPTAEECFRRLEKARRYHDAKWWSDAAKAEVERAEKAYKAALLRESKEQPALEVEA
jgi:hypothetical protein